MLLIDLKTIVISGGFTGEIVGIVGLIVGILGFVNFDKIVAFCKREPDPAHNNPNGAPAAGVERSKRNVNSRETNLRRIAIEISFSDSGNNVTRTRIRVCSICWSHEGRGRSSVSGQRTKRQVVSERGSEIMPAASGCRSLLPRK